MSLPHSEAHPVPAARRGHSATEIALAVMVVAVLSVYGLLRVADLLAEIDHMVGEQLQAEFTEAVTRVHGMAAVNHGHHLDVGGVTVALEQGYPPATPAGVRAVVYLGFSEVRSLGEHRVGVFSPGDRFCFVYAWDSEIDAEPRITPVLSVDDPRCR